jgi:ribosomal protein L19E
MATRATKRRRTTKRRPAKRSTGKKWGKVGAPNSAQRKAWMKKIRSSRKKYKKRR